MKQNQQFRGIGLVLLVIALITFASSLTSQGSLFSQEMTHQEFMVAVENKTIESVDINQNQQPPTGTLDILLKSGDRATVAVSDVKDAEKLLQDNSIDYVVENVPQENYLMSVIIPVALSAVVIMFMFMFMNARVGGGGGGNSKMLNFGKSRAKMSRTNSVNFSKVAGLEEEKEELEEIGVSKQFLGRVPYIVHMDRLSRAQLRQILVDKEHGVFGKKQKWFKRNGKTLTYDEDLVEEILDRMEEHDMGARGAAAMLETLIGTAEYDMFANGYKNLHLHKGMFFREEPVFDEQKGKSRDK